MPELRKDPVVGQWVIISAERSKRPSDFKVVKEEKEHGSCVFCEGHESKTPPEVYAVRKAGTDPDTPGWDVRGVPNKYPALWVEGELDREGVWMCDMMNGVEAHEVIIEIEVERTVDALVVRLRDEAAPFDPTSFSYWDLGGILPITISSQ